MVVWEVEDYLEEADQLFQDGERMIVREPVEGLKRFQQGVTYLLQGYLVSQDGEPGSDLKAVFEQCKQLEPEFESIEGELDYFFMPQLAEVDSEIVCDAANEIWDFVIGLIPE